MADPITERIRHGYPVSGAEDPPSGRETLVEALSATSASAMVKYRDLYVGRQSLGALVVYEALILSLSGMPGALGLWLRKTLYGAILGRIGHGTAIGPYVTLRSPGQIELGDHCFVDGHVVLDAKGARSRIRLGNSVLIGYSTVLSCASAALTVGDDVSIGPHCTLRAGLCPIELGSCLTIGAHTAIISGSPGYERLDIPIKKQVGSLKGISIGDDVWVGAGARIIDGVHIGSGSVVGAGAVVIGDIPAHSIAAGVPAKIIGQRGLSEGQRSRRQV